MRVLRRNTIAMRLKIILIAVLISVSAFAVATGVAAIGKAHAAGEINTAEDRNVIELADGDFAAVSGDNRLWALTISDPDSGDSVVGSFIDKAVYRDGDKIVYGEFDDAYARYRGATLVPKLNLEYTLSSSETSLRELLEGATVSYVHFDGDNNAIQVEEPRGSRDAVAHIITNVTIDFTNSQFALADKKCANYTVKENRLIIEKEWYIVNIANLLRDKSGNAVSFKDGVYGELSPAQAPRPEHGDTVVWTLKKDGAITSRFASVFDTEGNEKLYSSNIDGTAADTTQPIEGSFSARFATIDAGSYTLTGYVPAVQHTGEHTHWWDSSIVDDTGTYYHAITHSFDFAVVPFDISKDCYDDEGNLVAVEADIKLVPYTGSPMEPTDLVVRFGNMNTPNADDLRVLVYGRDYELEFANNIRAGRIETSIKGINNFTGVKISNNVVITNVDNAWRETPHINRWIYGAYNREVNSITAAPLYLYDDEKVAFSVSAVAGETVTEVDGLESFTLDFDEKSGEMLVSDEIAAKFAELGAGRYILKAVVTRTDSYYGIETEVEFRVLQAENRWASDVTVIPWASDDFDDKVNHFVAVPVLGSAQDVNIVVKNADGAVVYDSARDDIKTLSSLKRGKYTVTASVAETANYKGLETTVEFEVGRGSTEIIIAIAIISVFDVLLIAALVVLFLLARRRKS